MFKTFYYFFFDISDLYQKYGLKIPNLKYDRNSIFVDYLLYLLSMFKQTKDKFYADEFGYIVKQLNAIGYEILKNKDYIFVRKYGN